MQLINLLKKVFFLWFSYKLGHCFSNLYLLWSIWRKLWVFWHPIGWYLLEQSVVDLEPSLSLFLFSSYSLISFVFSPLFWYAASLWHYLQGFHKISAFQQFDPTYNSYCGTWVNLLTCSRESYIAFCLVEIQGHSLFQDHSVLWSI